MLAVETDRNTIASTAKRICGKAESKLSQEKITIIHLDK